MRIISRGTKCARAHVRKHDNDILVFQKALRAVFSPWLFNGTSGLPYAPVTRCVRVRAHTRAYSCIVLISRCQQRLAVGLDWYTADTPVTLRYERYGLAKTVPINHTRALDPHVRVCVFIHRQIKRGRAMRYWKYARIYIYIYMRQSHAYSSQGVRLR